MNIDRMHNNSSVCIQHWLLEHQLSIPLSEGRSGTPIQSRFLYSPHPADQGHCHGFGLSVLWF